MSFSFDVIVVGAGHAGCEAAAAAANLGSNTLLITMDMTKMAQMSCNPAIGGIAKGQIVREIDALGGYTGIVTDKTSIQFRMLNRSKGPAMWSPRAQCDRTLFSIEWRNVLESLPTLSFWQDNVIGLLSHNGCVTGVETSLGIRFYAKSVVMTNGTFLNGIIHVGRKNITGGRSGEPGSVGVTASLLDLGFESGRMKTGTPMRVDGRSVDFSKLTIQYGDSPASKFSFLNSIKPVTKQLPCYTAYTNLDVHGTIKTGFLDSPLFNGTIKSIGPRYCPSIEDKVRTFYDKDQHQLFLEPEGWNSCEYYLNGFSSSLPFEIQIAALKKVVGFENVKVFRPGYAIEYDFFQPTQLKHSLETKLISGLFFAGQINGTTGYEEAAAQGLVAGINAHQLIHDSDPLILSRDQAYIGVLIDDLVNKGVDEPYRMFTSRAEYRILLRQDNADERLTPIAYELGLASKERYDLMLNKREFVSRVIKAIKETSVTPGQLNSLLISRVSAEISQSKKAIDILLRPEISIYDIVVFIPLVAEIETEYDGVWSEVLESAEILLKYAGYIERERIVADKLKRLEHIKINPDFDYAQLASLSTEARQKLARIKPVDIGQASRIPGVSPSDINVLLVCFGR
ncbi:tRNA uridine-5-carboxymethylaminomethyl(34) synthesis enzyme MnmG [Williamwhitmania taraxaci]|uniref:tRNA uridine 5-carboxymethylaminomethyl modification enzyme MnmG n=1 Tax=Williamwhitmania taraxaci TaxID=1640674 RepID=A0A1G6GXN1_9BACT|nr:tRNA uridine-5-carboxymethylaminomethyl(34) synthesis enzyme MnmG [Williamwhitmania taraxaci]SDB86810.1 tRNA uridine 5-carboxymethylaminomethyl modification enzyme [Williamwhitmania taraxaci]